MPSKLGFWGIKPAIPFCKFSPRATKRIEKKEVNRTNIVKILKIIAKILKPQIGRKQELGIGIVYSDGLHITFLTFITYDVPMDS